METKRIKMLIQKELKNDDGENVDGTQYMLVLKIWEKIKKNENIFSKKCNSIINDG